MLRVERGELFVNVSKRPQRRGLFKQTKRRWESLWCVCRERVIQRTITCAKALRWGTEQVKDGITRSEVRKTRGSIVWDLKSFIEALLYSEMESHWLILSRRVKLSGAFVNGITLAVLEKVSRGARPVMRYFNNPGKMFWWLIQSEVTVIKPLHIFWKYGQQDWLKVREIKEDSKVCGPGRATTEWNRDICRRSRLVRQKTRRSILDMLPCNVKEQLGLEVRGSRRRSLELKGYI